MKEIYGKCLYLYEYFLLQAALAVVWGADSCLLHGSNVIQTNRHNYIYIWSATTQK